MIGFLKKYAPAFAAVLAAGLAALVPTLADNHLSQSELINVAILVVGAGGVFTAPNVPGAKYTKALLAVLSAVLVLLASLITGGLTAGEVVQLVLAGLGALGVGSVSNKE